jgi:antitoxin component YwqK of YwqJK toxin-antitoxin module
MQKKFKELNQDGKLKETGTLIDGVKQRRFVAYEYFGKTEPKEEEWNEFLTIRSPGKPCRVQKTIGFYVDGIANGDYQTFLNNSLVEEGTFIDGLAEGVFKTFYPTGQTILRNVASRLRKRKHPQKIKLLGNYKKGMLHGEQKERFEPDSDLVWISNYREGQPHGITRVISDSGKLKHVLTFKNGNLHGVEKGYNEDGRLESLTTWKDGVEHGPYRERESHYSDYDRETLLILERGMYVNGEKKGKYIKYFALLPFTPKKGREDSSWERGVHE